MFVCTPSKLAAYEDCPRRYRFTYVDRPTPQKGPPWAHNSFGAAVHTGSAIKMFAEASRVLRPGGELWTVFNSHLNYRSVIERMVGRTEVIGRNRKFTVTRSVRGLHDAHR